VAEVPRSAARATLHEQHQAVLPGAALAYRVADTVHRPRLVRVDKSPAGRRAPRVAGRRQSPLRNGAHRDCVDEQPRHADLPSMGRSLRSSGTGAAWDLELRPPVCGAARSAATKPSTSVRCRISTSITASARCSPARAAGNAPSRWASSMTTRDCAAICSGTCRRPTKTWCMGSRRRFKNAVFPALS